MKCFKELSLCINRYYRYYYVNSSFFHYLFFFVPSTMMSSESVEAYAKLQGETQSWLVNDLPFIFGRKTDKSPEAFLDICMDKKDKTISREYAILQYNDEKVLLVTI